MGGLKRDLPIVSNRMTITLLIFCLVTSGCALIKLKKENAESLSDIRYISHRKFFARVKAFLAFAPGSIGLNNVLLCKQHSPQISCQINII